MNQYFSFVRFGRLLRKHTAEHFSAYALGSIVLLGGLLAIFSFLSYLNNGAPSQGGQVAIYTLGLMGAAAFFASTALAEYSQGSSAALALTLPASHFEKYLVAWLFSVPGVLLVFTAAFYLADWLVLAAADRTDGLVNLLDNKTWLRSMLVYFLLLHAVALWGSIFFRRQPFVRTGFLLFGVIAILSLLNYGALGLLLGTKLGFSLPFSWIQLHDGPRLSLPESQVQWLSWVPVALVLLLWPAAYARLTEQQL
ncbi:hypothetical protein HHL22_06380 [Hymenobacter sp. RP-2-7]|uniref:Uncharacterized protein n=1 Tax=Hymenobacter polaris TaxID=2682546 RepID=A0A7Y0FLI0_9BACT|nr:hypothetical protein [Hymenobacter polaris]NML64828.1 hypothetical protein [Hymenobacter polaris]